MDPEEYLRRAISAPDATSRARFAKKGLASRAPLDKTTQALLLHQLYLSHYERRRFAEAHAVAEQGLALGVLPEVLHQDAARAALSSGDLEGALKHLRTAARRGPASRRALHYWTLGSVLFLAQRYEEAISALARAVRWGTGARPLYEAHLCLVKMAAGQPVARLQEIIDQLAGAPCGQGYGRFVLGHLAYATGAWEPARRYLEAFVRRTSSARPAMGIALEGEMRMARATLAKMAAN